MRGAVACVGYLAHSFDLINVRDLDLIAQARALCSRLVVGVYTDAVVTSLTRRPPVVPFTERLALVSHLRGIDEVRHHDATTPLDEFDCIFVEGGAPEWAPARVVRLNDVRRSDSAQLLRALEPIGEAVA